MDGEGSEVIDCAALREARARVYWCEIDRAERDYLEARKAHQRTLEWTREVREESAARLKRAARELRRVETRRQAEGSVR